MNKFLGESGLDSLISLVKQMFASHEDDNKMHLPLSRRTGQVLVANADGTSKWIDFPNVIGADDILIDTLSYGVSWVPGQKDPVCTRIGNGNLHKTLPIQSNLRGCVAKGLEIQYYLNPNDWTQPNEDGVVPRLDGYDGNVCVDTSADFYIKSFHSAALNWVRISQYQLDSTWIRVPRQLIHAYRSTVLRSVPEDMGWLSTLEPNSMISVCNTAAYCRGGNNNSSYDTYLDTDPFRTQLGKPATYLPRATARTYMRKTGLELQSYTDYKDVLYWLWVIEYATFYCQGAYNEELTVEGYHQGGMGPGANWDSSSWSNYNGYYPIIPCGYTNELGNRTGVKDLTIPATDKTTEKTFKTFRYRGLECDWDIWTNLDGFLMNTPVNSSSEVLPEAMIFTDPANYTDSLVGANPDRVVFGARNSGYTLEFALGSSADIVPGTIGGNTSQGKTDYYWVNYDDTPETLLVGGGLYGGSYCGFGAFYVSNHVSDSWAIVGFRGVGKNPTLKSA